MVSILSHKIRVGYPLYIHQYQLDIYQFWALSLSCNFLDTEDHKGKKIHNNVCIVLVFFYIFKRINITNFINVLFTTA